MALASATTLVVLISGNVAAYKLDRDDGSGAPSSPCHQLLETVVLEAIGFVVPTDPGVVLDQHLMAKLGTTAGCEVIVYG